MSIVDCWDCPLEFSEVAIFACVRAAVLFLAMFGWLRASGVVKFVAGLVLAAAVPLAALSLISTIRLGVVWRVPWLAGRTVPLTIAGIAVVVGMNAAALLAAAWLSRRTVRVIPRGGAGSDRAS